MGDAFKEGMVFAFNINLFDPELAKWRNRRGVRGHGGHHRDQARARCTRFHVSFRFSRDCRLFRRRSRMDERSIARPGPNIRRIMSRGMMRTAHPSF